MYNKENYFGHGALLLCGLSFKKGVFTLIKTVTLNGNQQPTKEQKSKYTKENRCLIISNIGHFTKLFWRIPLNGSAIFV